MSLPWLAVWPLALSETPVDVVFFDIYYCFAALVFIGEL